jgi:glycosyltransferase involved in cell wall biosynthesis
VTFVAKRGSLFRRFLRYARALREQGRDVDVVLALSSVSVGVPLILARLSKPKKILRLGGDFFWERYTDAGGMKGLADWYRSPFGFWRAINTLCMGSILRRFDAIVYSTDFQRTIHEASYTKLPPSTVIENALPALGRVPTLHSAHTPFRLLSMGRFVGFKNTLALLEALPELPDTHCTFIGSGPMESALKERARTLSLSQRVTFLPAVSGEEKERALLEHDLLVIPSVTDISPNTALEARAAGLPVLLTTDTGLSEALTQGMIRALLRTPANIVRAVQDVRRRYDTIAQAAAMPLHERSWEKVADEWEQFFVTVL